ncbi:DsbA family oxidoreductase, partial [Streptomyces thermodiastaticus]
MPACGAGLPAAPPGRRLCTAHRFLYRAEEHGQGSAFFVQPQRDLFTDAVDICDTGHLVRTVSRLGVPVEAARTTAHCDARADAVRADQRIDRASGNTGVPFAVLGPRLAVAGVAFAGDCRHVIGQARREGKGQGRVKAPPADPGRRSIHP